MANTDDNAFAVNGFAVCERDAYTVSLAGLGALHSSSLTDDAKAGNNTSLNLLATGPIIGSPTVGYHFQHLGFVRLQVEPAISLC